MLGTTYANTSHGVLQLYRLQFAGNFAEFISYTWLIYALLIRGGGGVSL